MCRRLVEDGRDLVWVPDAVVDHYHDLSAKRFWQQHFRYGRGAYQYHCAQGLRADPNDQNPSRGVWNMRAKFYLDLVRSPFAPRRAAAAADRGPVAVLQLPNALPFSPSVAATASRAATTRRAQRLRWSRRRSDARSSGPSPKMA